MAFPAYGEYWPMIASFKTTYPEHYKVFLQSGPVNDVMRFDEYQSMTSNLQWYVVEALRIAGDWIVEKQSENRTAEEKRADAEEFKERLANMPNIPDGTVVVPEGVSNETGFEKAAEGSEEREDAKSNTSYLLYAAAALALILLLKK